MELTPHYAYHMLRDGEKFSRDDYAFTWQDRLNMDHKDYLGAEAHKHTGAGPQVVTPTVPLNLTMEDGGYLPAGTTVRYRYTWVDQYGAETGPSAEATVTTPVPVSTPDRPQVSSSNTGGSLPSGNYFYVLSAYVDDINHETNYGGRGYVTILSGNTNSVTLTFPTLPAGADGWNIYRRSPGSTRYLYIDSVDMSVATPPTDYVDVGVTADSNKIAPAFNNTGQSKKVTVSLPGATPAVPAGLSWKLYRTYVSGDWDHSLVHWIVEVIAESDDTVEPFYEDLGNATLAGIFPDTSQIVGSPSKIDLTNAGEATGVLPTGMVRYPHEAVFIFEGPVIPDLGSFRWRMPFEQGEILKASGVLGVGSTPATDPIQIDVRIYHDAEWNPVSESSLLEIPAGEESGTLEFTEDDNIDLVEGDYLTVDILQAGGGATPTDENLTVQVIMWVKEGSATQSLTF